MPTRSDSMYLPLSFLLITLLSVSVMTSCSVEKRLYQRGYYIEWNKRARAVTETEVVIKKQVSDQLILADEQHPETIVAVWASEETTATEQTAVLSETVLQTQDQASNTSESTTVTHTTNSDQQTEVLGESHEQKSTIEKASHRPGSPRSNPFLRGLMLMLIGLLLIGLGLLFNSALGVFGTVLLVIFGLGGAIMIIVGVFVMTFG